MKTQEPDDRFEEVTPWWRPLQEALVFVLKPILVVECLVSVGVGVGVGLYAIVISHAIFGATEEKAWIAFAIVATITFIVVLSLLVVRRDRPIE